jgi:hypothetical protein
MPVNWAEVQKALVPIKDYEDGCRRLSKSLAYPFVTHAYNLSMPALADYTQKLLGGDARGRYTEYLSKLTGTLSQLHDTGVQDVLDLMKRIDTREKLENFVEQSGMHALDLVMLLWYLVYWFIPAEKYLSGLVCDDPDVTNDIQILAELGVRTNLQLLQQGLTPPKRQSLAEQSGLPVEVVLGLVNRADFSRLPWASKATISNLIGAGYASLAQLADADPHKLYADFFRYGKSIGKNLKLGNEIENSHRIARIIPRLVISSPNRT